jgi:NAD(P)-dependent dehydrogenase (short-subunit alcohol dehydrogenase family)
MGNIADNGSGGSILYQSSKTALNATMKSLAINLQIDRIGVLIFHLGWVQADTSGSSALIDTKTSVTGMSRQIEVLTFLQISTFINV